MTTQQRLRALGKAAGRQIAERTQAARYSCGCPSTLLHADGNPALVAHLGTVPCPKHRAL